MSPLADPEDELLDEELDLEELLLPPPEELELEDRLLLEELEDEDDDEELELETELLLLLLETELELDGEELDPSVGVVKPSPLVQPPRIPTPARATPPERILRNSRRSWRFASSAGPGGPTGSSAISPPCAATRAANVV